MRHTLSDYFKSIVGGLIIGLGFCFVFSGLGVGLVGTLLGVAAIMGGTMMQGAAAVGLLALGAVILKCAKLIRQGGRAIAEDAMDRRPVVRFLSAIGGFVLSAYAMEKGVAMYEFNRAAEYHDTREVTLPVLGAKILAPTW